jgi:hypothetical protein
MMLVLLVTFYECCLSLRLAKQSLVGDEDSLPTLLLPKLQNELAVIRRHDPRSLHCDCT